MLVLALVAAAFLGTYALLHAISNQTSNEHQAQIGEQGFIPSGVYTDGTFTQLKTVFDGTDTSIPNKMGVDVSEMQGIIDWDQVAASGISFAYVRVGYRGMTEGDLFKDELYQRNLEGAKRAGLECGAYFYSQAITVAEAKEEAAYVLEQLDGVSLNYPVAFDYEVLTAGQDTRVSTVGHEDAAAIAHAFCTAIEDAGYDAIIYGNPYDLNHFTSRELSAWPIWLAEYTDAPTYTGKHDVMLWQYSSTGQVQGIGTVVDLNVDMRTVSASL